MLRNQILYGGRQSVQMDCMDKTNNLPKFPEALKDKGMSLAANRTPLQNVLKDLFGTFNQDLMRNYRCGQQSISQDNMNNDKETDNKNVMKRQLRNYLYKTKFRRDDVVYKTKLTLQCGSLYLLFYYFLFILCFILLFHVPYLSIFNLVCPVLSSVLPKT